MLTVLALLGVVAVLFLAAVIATRGGGELADAPPDAADVGLPGGPLRASDVEALRFPLAVRGYRMAEVDAALERLADELAARDRLIQDLAERSDVAERSPVVEESRLAERGSRTDAAEADRGTGDAAERRRPDEQPDGPAGASRRAAGDWPT